MSEVLEPEDANDYTGMELPWYLLDRINRLRGMRKKRKPGQRKREPAWFVVLRSIDLYEQTLKED